MLKAIFIWNKIEPTPRNPSFKAESLVSMQFSQTLLLCLQTSLQKDKKLKEDCALLECKKAGENK